MRKIREILRLHDQGLSVRHIAVSVGLARSTVAECLRRAEAAELGGGAAQTVSEAQLEERLYPPRPRAGASTPLPDWSQIHTELRRPGVTLQLLWEEYQDRHPEGYRYSRYVVTKFMLPLSEQARDFNGFPGPARNIKRQRLELQAFQERHQ